MTKPNFFLLSCLVALSLPLFAAPIVAQPRKDGQDPVDNSRKVKSEPKNAYKRWLDEDVTLIITKEERNAFLALKTDEERENFIWQFWNRRDPDPDTEVNEYREEHYERIAYANEKFTSAIPGSKTDRGRIYIAHGKPDSVESHPSGGSYERPSYEGGGSTSTYPFETWFYRHLDGVGDGLEIEFVDPTGTGEYRLARNANEKDALLYVPGAGQTLAEQMGMDTRANRIAGNQSGMFARHQDNPFERQLRNINLMRPPPVQFDDLRTFLNGSPVIDKNPLDFDLRVDFFRLSDYRVIAAITVQADNKDLGFENEAGVETGRMNILGRITAVSGKRSDMFEDSVTTSATTKELSELKSRKSIYQRTVALAPGTYKVEVVVRDVKSGNKGVVSQGFQVPRYDEKKLSTSSLILATRLRSTNESDLGGMFIIGGAKVVPNLESRFRRGDDVGVYLQVYNSAIDQTTLRPAVDVEYVLTKGGNQVLKQPEDWSGLSESSGRLTLARLLPTTSLDPGEYEVKILTKDRITGQTVENKGKFTIIN